MKNIIEEDSPLQIVSPTVFIQGLDNPEIIDELLLNQTDKIIEPKSTIANTNNLQEEAPVDSQKSEKKRLAGVKAREKKKKYIETLQESVKLLEEEISQYDTEMSKCRDELSEAMRISKKNSSEHDYTFSQMQRLVLCEYPDIDRLNLLLDVIQNRIGANGRERQSKIQYNFKQIISTMFPAIHRYFMYSAEYELDCFSKQEEKQKHRWTWELYQTLNLTSTQKDKIRITQQAFKLKRYDTIHSISQLKQVHRKLKQEQDIFEKTINHIREDMNPIQSARITLFGEKNKLRKEFCYLGKSFEETGLPRKQVKRQF